MTTRPQSIIRFEWAIWALIALEVIRNFLNWDAVMAGSEARAVQASLGPAAIYASVAFSVLIPLLLWYFIARRGSNVAKRIFAALSAYVLFKGATGLGGALNPFDANAALFVLSLILQIVAVVLLFRPDASAWFKAQR